MWLSLLMDHSDRHLSGVVHKPEVIVAERPEYKLVTVFINCGGAL